jgi:hypothetical protein
MAFPIGLERFNVGAPLVRLPSGHFLYAIANLEYFCEASLLEL